MLNEILKEENINAYLKYFSLDSKKYSFYKIFYTVIFLIIYSLITLIVENNLLFLGLPIVLFIGFKFPYIRLIMQKKKQDLIVSYLFPEFLQSFMALLTSSGNIYKALIASIPYTEDPIKSKLEKLVKNLQKSNDREHYMEFAKFIGSNEAIMIMDMIYQFSERGIKREAFLELENYIQSIVENKTNELIQKKINNMFVFGFIPTVMSIVFTLGLSGILLVYYISKINGALNFPS